MLLIREILGREDEARFAVRQVEYVEVTWDEASKRRLRRMTDAGTDVAIDLPRGAYLADGSVLHDDGERIVVARRRLEQALLVRFDCTAPAEHLVEQALRLGHALGNQHVPMDIAGAEAQVPLTTSEEVARATLGALGLSTVRVTVAPAALGRERPLPVGHTHEHRARPDDHDR